MLPDLQSLLDLVDLYHRWVIRVLYVLAIIALLFAGYKYGYDKGYEHASGVALDWIKNNCQATEPASKSSLSEGQPGKMWIPES